MTCEACGEDHEPSVVVAVEPDAETLLPAVVLGIPTPDGDEYMRVVLDPQEAFGIGSYLVQAAAAAASLYTDMIDKTVDERREVMDLYEAFGLPEAPDPA